jgi:hypothetical protein
VHGVSSMLAQARDETAGEKLHAHQAAEAG